MSELRRRGQTHFQESVNIDPDVAYAPILDLDTLDVTIRKFAWDRRRRGTATASS